MLCSDVTGDWLGGLGRPLGKMKKKSVLGEAKNAVGVVEIRSEATLQNKLEFENLSCITSFMLIIALNKLS